MAYRKCHRAPLLHLGFEQEYETQRIRLLQRQIHNQELMMDTLVIQLDGDDLDHLRQLLSLMGPSLLEPKMCYWTEGVPSEKKTDFGRIDAATAPALVAN